MSVKLHTLTLFVSVALLASPLAAAEDGHAAHRNGGKPQAVHAKNPYSEMQGRPIKALSEQQVEDLQTGKGMSLALAAELNGYPGPSHTLELADQMELTKEQRARTQSLFKQMQQEARAAGEQVLSAEAALDKLFKEKQATPDALKAAIAKAALAQGTLRETHLRYHLSMVEVLSPDQVTAYGKLRGY